MFSREGIFSPLIRSQNPSNAKAESLERRQKVLNLIPQKLHQVNRNRLLLCFPLNRDLQKPRTLFIEISLD